MERPVVDEEERVTSRTKVILAVAALAVVGGAAYMVTAGVGRPAASVEAAQVQEEDLAVTITAAGRVESGIRADVFPSAAGTLAEVSVTDGASVRAGTVLATMDTEPLEAQVKQAEAGLAAAESQLAAVDKQEPSSGEISAARAGTDASWSGYEAALEAADAASGAGPSSSDLAAADAATDAAYSAYQAAKSAYDVIKASVEASASPAPDVLADLEAAKIAKEQAYAGYLQAKSALDSLRAYDGSSAEAQADAGAEQAYAAYLGARAQQARLEGTNLSAERRAAQASIDQARQALVVAEDALSGAAMTAPIDGVVLFNALGTPAADGATPKASVGSAVAPGSAPFTVVQMDGLSFSAEVDEVDVDSIEVGMTGMVRLDAFADQTFEAQVAEIKPAATLTATGGTVFPVYVSLAGVDANVLIGMQGDVEIEVNSVAGAVTAPVEALFDEGGTAYVYLIEGGTLVRTKVEIGTITETRVEITSGVQPGDTVALSGPVELVDGMTVEIAE